MNRNLYLAGLLLLAGCAAPRSVDQPAVPAPKAPVAQASPTAPKPQTASTGSAPSLRDNHESVNKAAPSDVICTYEQATGSHLRKRTCMTKEERDAKTKADQSAMDNLQRSKLGRGRAETQ